MKYEIKHTINPSLEIQLGAGESVYTQGGAMAWMTDGIDMKTQGKGGALGALGRMMAGASLLLTTYSSTNPNGSITFVPDSPGRILPFELQANQTLIAQASTFLVAQNSVNFEVTLTKKLGVGFFGGEGFVLQKITGPGLFFAQVDGEVEEFTLGPNQIMKIDPGHIALMEPSVQFDIQMVKGLTNIFFSGEGLFLATAKGPGKIWLQTMPISNLAGAISRFIPSKG